jgi:hypothetical protein
MGSDRVLWVFFEDLSADLHTEVERIARFMGVGANDPAVIDAATRVSSFEFMGAKENAHHYDEHFTKSFVYEQMGIDPTKRQDVTKVHKGKVGSRRQLPGHIKARLDAKWDAVLKGPTGCSGYPELREQVRRMRKF